MKLFGDGTRVSVFPHKNGGSKRLGGITVVVKFGQGVGDEFSLVGNRGKVPELDVTCHRGRWRAQRLHGSVWVARGTKYSRRNRVSEMQHLGWVAETDGQLVFHRRLLGIDGEVSNEPVEVRRGSASPTIN